MSGFDEVQFPPDISYGASGGPGYSTTVITTVSGHERRNANWAMARGRWNVAHGLKKRKQVAELIAFFRARRGRAYGFRFKDWTDYQALAQSLGIGDGATTSFQLVKHYASGGEPETRLITKPVPGTVKIYRDGVEATSGWTMDTATGLVTFTTAPAIAVQVTANFAFDVPARFDSDQMDLTIETYQLGCWGQIVLVEPSFGHAGRSLEVSAWTQTTGEIALFLPMGYPIEPGDAFAIHHGCDKRLTTCSDRFANVLNFRGEP